MAGAFDSNKDMLDEVIFPRQSQRTHRAVLFIALQSLFAGINSDCVLSHIGHPVSVSPVLDLDEVLCSFPDSFLHLCKCFLLRDAGVDGEMT